MSVEEQLTQRFVEAIRKSFQPCPLIGSKWFLWKPNATPPQFQFAGVGKLAKAIGAPPAAIAKRLLKNLDTRGLDADVTVSAKDRIVLKFKTPPQGK